MKQNLLNVVTKVYENNIGNKKVLLETIEQLPIDKVLTNDSIQSNTKIFIRVNDKDYTLSIDKNITPLTNQSYIYSAKLHWSNYDSYYDPNHLFIELSVSTNYNDTGIKSKLITNAFDYITFDECIQLKNILEPLLLNQVLTLDNFAALYKQEARLKNDVESERAKILRKEEREKARLIAAAQLEKEKQVQHNETPRKKK
jgi:hypothetical protein